MAPRAVTVAVLMVAVAALVGGMSAQSTNECMQALISMSPCIKYITGNAEAPSSSCCFQLGAITRKQPECICFVINGEFAELAIDVNKTLALGLPDACYVQTPSVCNSAAVLTTLPASLTPAGDTETSPDTGSKLTPTTDVDGNGGPSLLQRSAGIVVPTVHAMSALSFH